MSPSWHHSPNGGGYLPSTGNSNGMEFKAKSLKGIISSLLPSSSSF